MSYNPKAGDYVRAVMEGEVTKVFSDGDWRIELVEHYGTEIPHEGNVTFEKIDRPEPPYKYGTIVQHRMLDYLRYLLGVNGYTDLTDGAYVPYDKIVTGPEYFSRKFYRELTVQ